MSAHICILGAGTGGTLTANRLRKEVPDVLITVVDENDRHVYQPGLLFVPFGLAHPEDIVRPRGKQLHDGIEYQTSKIGHVDLKAQRVSLANGTMLSSVPSARKTPLTSRHASMIATPRTAPMSNPLRAYTKPSRGRPSPIACAVRTFTPRMMPNTTE